ncbi:MAG: sugar ABC transporter permease [Pseudonocardiales bacterium]|nr:MAG: sugar ABC transporter permease [Pseudonocardiales bacterium]
MVAALLGPALVLVAAFVVAPVGYALWLSLTNKTLTGFGAQTPKFVGLANYRQLLTSGDFGHSLRLTAEFIVFSAILGQFLLGLLAALLLTQTGIRLKGVFGGAILLPMVVPEVVASLAWASMLAPGTLGTLNRGFATVGVDPVSWLQRYPMAAIIIVNTWRGIAFAMIMFQAAIEGISREVLEAARIDGAGVWQVLRHVTLPLIRGPVFLFLLLTTITTSSVFGLVYFLTQGGPGQQTQVTSIYIYQHSFRFFQLGLGSAASVILLGIVLVLGVTYVRLARVEV